MFLYVGFRNSDSGFVPVALNLTSNYESTIKWIALSLDASISEAAAVLCHVVAAVMAIVPTKEADELIEGYVIYFLL
jgi:hypothetical protein